MALLYESIDIDIPVLQETKKVEHTELTDIDRAVASFFQFILDSLVVTDTNRKENLEFFRFTEKRKEAKIYAGDFDTPVDFLTKLTAKIGDVVEEKRKDLLPVCYIGRDPAISFTDGTDYIDVTGYGVLQKDDDTYAVINKSFINLNYNVTILAWSKPTLSRIALGLMMWLRHTKKNRKHTFVAKTLIAGQEIDLHIVIKGLRDALTSPSEVDHQSQRLFASSISIEVCSEVYEAEFVDVTKGRLSLESEIID